MSFGYILKPCAHCGSTEVEIMTNGTCTGPEAGKEEYSVDCPDCHSHVKFWDYPLEEKLGRELTNQERLNFTVESWNKRFIFDDNETKKRVRSSYRKMEEAFYELSQLIKH